MSRVVYLNGEYLAPDQARISIFDRGALFGDAVYEVAGVLGGKLVDFDHHMDRLYASLDKLSIPPPLERGDILGIEKHGDTIRDTVSEDPEDSVKLPDTRIGITMVFRVFDRVSYGLIMESTRVINVGDIITNP